MQRDNFVVYRTLAKWIYSYLKILI
jgi:hypothetical protein